MTSIKCITCGSAKHNSDSCWSNMEDDEVNFQTKTKTETKTETKSETKTETETKSVFSYANIASKNVKLEVEVQVEVVFVCDSDKTEIAKKCENAVYEWAKCKNENIVSKKVCDDEEIICKKCGIPFVFTKKTKDNYLYKGWNMPKICKICSQARYEERKTIV
jgi:hypothetical protein